jgi:hypothetical protein
MIRISEQFIVFSKENEVESPGIDADAYDVASATIASHPDAVPDLVPLMKNVPMEAAVKFDRAVVETVNLFEPDLPTVEESKEMTPARRAHVDR